MSGYAPENEMSEPADADIHPGNSDAAGPGRRLDDVVDAEPTGNRNGKAQPATAENVRARTGPPDAHMIEREEEGSAGKTRGPNNRALVRKTVAKYRELAAADPTVVAVAAALFGTVRDPATLTVEVMVAHRAALGPLVDLHKIAEAEAMESMVLGVEMGRARMKAVWSVLGAVDAHNEASTLPVSDAKAALKVAQTVQGLDPSVMERVDLAVELLRK